MLHTVTFGEPEPAEESGRPGFNLLRHQSHPLPPLVSAGERLLLNTELTWVDELARQSVGSEGSGPDVDRRPHTVAVRVERARSPFPVEGWSVLTRGAWHRDGQVVVKDVCTSGFDLHVQVLPPGPGAGVGQPVFTFRWRPPLRTCAANTALRTRFVLLARATLLQYPMLWAAGLRGRAPLHASAAVGGGCSVVVAGPGGVGKSSVLAAELASGGEVSSDNLCVTDGHTVWGLVEPLRLPPAQVAQVPGAGRGRSSTHGRRELSPGRRLPSLVPDQVMVLHRGTGREPVARTIGRSSAINQLVAGTYCAGELRRYWPLAALLSAGTGVGPAHPPVTEAAAALVDGCRCVEVELGQRPGHSLTDLVNLTPKEPAWT